MNDANDSKSGILDISSDSLIQEKSILAEKNVEKGNTIFSQSSILDHEMHVFRGFYFIWRKIGPFKDSVIAAKI